MITTKDLAKLAGVSQSTVSRSLNDSPEISKETKERITKLAKEHGYILPVKRRAHLKNNQNPLIAVVVSSSFTSDTTDNSWDIYLSFLYNSLCFEISKRGYTPVIITAMEKLQVVKYVDKFIGREKVVGLIISNTEFNPSLESYLSSRDIPHIYTQYFARSLLKSMHIVDVDHYNGGYLAARHFLELGHTNVMTVTHKGADFDDRTQGFFDALSHEKVPVGEDRILASENTYNASYKLFSENVKRIMRYTGVFVQTDIMAIACINALVDAGVNVPKDISIMGFDGIQQGIFCRPRLTTLNQPFKTIASMSVEKLLQIISNPASLVTHSFIPPNLIYRESTGKPRE